MWGTDTSGLGFFLGDILGGPARGGPKAKNALSFLMQVPWAAFGLVWCIAAWRGNRQEPVDWTFPLLWVALLWFLHALVEPLARHHLALIPILAAMAFPGYWAAVREWRAQRAGSPPAAVHSR